MKKTVREFRVVIMDDKDKVKKIVTCKDYYDESTQSFDFSSLKTHIYMNKNLKPFNYVLYGRDMHVISFMYKHELYDLQGYQDWAEIKNYIEVKDSDKYVRAKALKKRCKDIEREAIKRMERGERAL